MSKKLEKKILEEIKRRVLEKDKELSQQQEKKAVSEATKEALADMTVLSRNEVEDIAKSVRQEMTKKAEKQKRILIIVAIVVAIVGYQGYKAIMNKDKPAQYTEISNNSYTPFSGTPVSVFVEKFNNNKNGWDIYNDFEQKRYFENNEYIIETNESGYCYWDFVEFDLPKSYTVEVTSRWLRGKFKDYGVIFQQEAGEYFVFQLRADGFASISAHKDDEWVLNQNWMEGFGNKDGSAVNTQKIVVNGNNFEYYVNDKLFKKSNLYNLNIRYIGVRVCDVQKVAFQNIVVKDNTTGDILMNEDFKNPHEEWEKRNDLTKKSEIKNNKLFFTGYTDGYCYWTSTNTPINQKSEITLKSYWQNGEMANFGLMVIQNDDNYFACEVRNDGSSRLVKCKDSEYTDIRDYVNTGIDFDKNTKIEQIVQIDDGVIKYYLNQQFIGKSNINDMNPKEIGVRICGRQTVAYDEIIVKNY